MPVLFIGHGSPMNAIEENEFSRGWAAVAATLPRPAAILCISAHWETRGTRVTAMERPRTIHDFYGFPPELHAVQYPAPGSPWLAGATKQAIRRQDVGLDDQWGFDHGCWSVLRRMYPDADVPVVQLSLDRSRSPRDHYDLARELAPLRTRGVLILASGNIVHNLGRMATRSGGLDDVNEPYALDWALEADTIFKKLIADGNYTALADYASLGSAARLAVPTPEHFLPLLYALALKGKEDAIEYFNDQPVAGSITMTSLTISRG